MAAYYYSQSNTKHILRLLLLICSTMTFLLPQRVLAQGLQLENVTIPETGLRGSSETLRCDFHLGADTLYSLKWYKDDKEFYRIAANNHLSPTTFPLPGVKVAIKKSNLHQVTLTNLTLESSGIYRCEISAETSFRTQSKEGNMTVIVPPERLKPTISNISNMYHMGETINGNCSALRSHPAANLTFHIHDTKVDSNSLIEYEPVSENGGLETAVLGIRLVVGHQHFLGGVLRLKCTARIGKRTWQENLVIEHRNFYNSHVASAGQRGYSAGTVRTAHPTEVVAGLCSLLLGYGLLSVGLHGIIMSLLLSSSWTSSPSSSASSSSPSSSSSSLSSSESESSSSGTSRSDSSVCSSNVSPGRPPPPPPPSHSPPHSYYHHARRCNSSSRRGSSSGSSSSAFIMRQLCERQLL